MNARCPGKRLGETSEPGNDGQDDPKKVAKSVGIDLEALELWLQQSGIVEGIDALVLLGGGTQNILLRVMSGSKTYVLRRPPLNKRENSDETMRRESLVLAALKGSPVPHPELVAFCADRNIMQCAFYIMEDVRGVSPFVGLSHSYLEHAEWRYEFGRDLARTAAAIGMIDYRAVGLAELGNPDGFLQRQVDRWMSQLDSYNGLRGYETGSLPGCGAVGRWLSETRHFIIRRDCCTGTSISVTFCATSMHRELQPCLTGS